MDMTSYFRSGCFDLDEIRQSDAEWHADYGEMVDIETGCDFAGVEQLYTGNLLTVILAHYTHS